MSTKKLAKELGLLRQRSRSSSSGSSRPLTPDQTFPYLVVIDFESTCWSERSSRPQEIIEFPAVLLNASLGEVEAEFHTYVQPQEHPVLSRFCTELTGITQLQVETGIPLHICLSRFSRWLKKLQLEKGLVFDNKQRCSAPAPSPKLCAFLTWSDWDLGVCLQYECKRKQLHKPDVLNSWIDLRNTYRLFYNRKPKGLNGALQDLGIQFSGREHSGLDDARNTAQLAARMMRDGCVMKITRSLERSPAVITPMFGNASADKRKEKPNAEKEEDLLTTDKPSSSKNPQLCQIKLCSKNNTLNLDTKENSHSLQEPVQICKSLISPRTLLNGPGGRLWGRGRGAGTSGAVSHSSFAATPKDSSPHGDKSLVLCSTTLGCLSHLPHPPHPNRLSKSGARTAEEQQGGDLLVEEEERCGSYDHVVLEADDDAVNEADRIEYTSDSEGGCRAWGDTDNSEDGISAKNYFTTGDLSRASASTKKRRTDQLKRLEQNRVISEPGGYFAVPKAVTWGSRTNGHEKGLESSAQLREKSDGALHNLKTNGPSLRHKPFPQDKTSTPNPSFAKPQPVVTQNKKLPEIPKSSFSIYTEPAERSAEPPADASRRSLCIPNRVLGSLSANALSSFSALTEGRTITSPLCACGRRAKRQLVSNGGPNQGRGFYCCPVRRSGAGGRVQKGCDFFKWESSLVKRSSAAGSVSLCHSSSTPHCRPQQRSMHRKSC